MKILLRTVIVAALVVFAGMLVAQEGRGATPRQPTVTRSFLLTMWGMKPYSVPPEETAPSITRDGKWTKLPVGPENATYATVHHFVPETIVVNKGDKVKLTVLNLGLHNHGFAIPEYGVDMMVGGRNITAERGDLGNGKIHGTATGGPNARTVTFVANKAGVFTYMCNLPFNKAANDCNPLHDRIIGQLIVIDR
jgi:plastocyanin